MSGTVEQNTTYIATTLAKALAPSTHMSQLQAKAVELYRAGTSTSYTANWVVFPSIKVPAISGVYLFSINNDLNGGTNAISLVEFVTIQVENTVMYAKRSDAFQRGGTRGLVIYFILNSIAVSGSTYVGNTTNGVAIPLPTGSDYYVPFVDGVEAYAANIFSCRISRIG